MKRLLALIMLLITFAAPAFAAAEDLSAVRSEGIASKSADFNEVKRKALDQALKNAVITAAETIIKKDSVDINLDAARAAVSSSPRSFVLNYKILAEGWINHMEEVPPVPTDLPDAAEQTPGAVELYHIWIEASVDAGQVKSELLRAAGGDTLTSAVKINILDLVDYGAFKNLMTSLKRIASIKDLSYNSFSRGRIEVTATVSGSADGLSEKVAREAGDSFMVIAGGPNMLIIKPARRTTIQ
ncbi:MAG TPA: hypothetical protein VNK06_02380 [Thermodesulfobacteriota bacterium]|nr:hypothetical protein [Thermodesulfobacteriota bacterium]